jgi:hypothetical protein
MRVLQYSVCGVKAELSARRSVHIFLRDNVNSVRGISAFDLLRFCCINFKFWLLAKVVHEV